MAFEQQLILVVEAMDVSLDTPLPCRAVLLVQFIGNVEENTGLMVLRTGPILNRFTPKCQCDPLGKIALCDVTGLSDTSKRAIGTNQMIACFGSSFNFFLSK